MRLSTLLLICLFLFACTHLTAKTAWRLRIQDGHIAALSLALLALGAFPLSLSASVTVNPASAALLVYALLLCRGLPDILEALLTGLLAGLLGWGLCSLIRFYEMGFLLALPAAILPALLQSRKRTALLAATCAPLFYGLFRMLEDWYLFDWRTLAFGGDIQLDAQIAALFLLALLWYLPHGRRRGERRIPHPVG